MKTERFVLDERGTAFYIIKERDKFVGILAVNKQTNVNLRNRKEDISFVAYIQKTPIGEKQFLEHLRHPHLRTVIATAMDYLHDKKKIVEVRSLEMGSDEYRDTLWRLFKDNDLSIPEKVAIEDFVGQREKNIKDPHEQARREISAFYEINAKAESHKIIGRWERYFCEWN